MIFRLLAATGAAAALLASIDPALCRADQVTYNLTPLGNLPSSFSATLTEIGSVAADGKHRVDFELTTYDTNDAKNGPAIISVYLNWDPRNLDLNASLVDPSAWSIPSDWTLNTSSDQSIPAYPAGSFSAGLSMVATTDSVAWSVESLTPIDANSFAVADVSDSDGPQVVAAGVLKGESFGLLAAPFSVPEPAGLIAMLGIGGMGLIGLAWRRRRAGENRGRRAFPVVDKRSRQGAPFTATSGGKQPTTKNRKGAKIISSCSSCPSWFSPSLVA